MREMTQKVQSGLLLSARATKAELSPVQSLTCATDTSELKVWGTSQ